MLPVALLLVLGGTAGGIALVGHFGGHNAGSADPSDYSTGYAGSELTAPDDSYDFDIKTGTVVPAGSTPWHLELSSDGFQMPADSDAAIAEDDVPTAADCTAAIDQHPVTALKFDDLPAGRAFCVRSRGTRDIAVVRVLSVAAGNGPVQVSMDYYRSNA